MTSGHPDPLVAAYLRRLDTAAAALPSDRRAELIAEIRAHIEDALREAGTSDEVAVRNVLERLGSPEEIASEAPGRPPVLGRVGEGEGAIGPLERGALAVLALGGLVPILGWATGVVLAMASGVWSTRDKLAGVLLGMAVATVLCMLHLALGGRWGDLGSFELLIFGWGFLSGLPSAAYLAFRLHHRNPTASQDRLASAGTAGD